MGPMTTRKATAPPLPGQTARRGTPSSASAADRPEARREERLVDTLHGGHRRRAGPSNFYNDWTPLKGTQPFTVRGTLTAQQYPWELPPGSKG